jgi:hypothetical protein
MGDLMHRAVQKILVTFQSGIVIHHCLSLVQCSKDFHSFLRVILDAVAN